MKFKQFVNPHLEYHHTLNPKLWEKDGDGDWVLHPKVKAALVKIAARFIEVLKLPATTPLNVVFTGSSCNYNWSHLSDIDLHVLCDTHELEKLGRTLDIEDCLQAKKALFNEQHDITIYGIPVELYATTMDPALVPGSGVYSLTNGAWIQLPERKHIVYHDDLIAHKAGMLGHEIDLLIHESPFDFTALKAMNEKLFRLRQAGLTHGGEFSMENLTFKALRNEGYVQKLRDQIIKAEDHNLSLTEKKHA